MLFRTRCARDAEIKLERLFDKPVAKIQQIRGPFALGLRISLGDGQTRGVQEVLQSVSSSLPNRLLKFGGLGGFGCWFGFV